MPLLRFRKIGGPVRCLDEVGYLMEVIVTSDDDRAQRVRLGCDKKVDSGDCAPTFEKGGAKLGVGDGCFCGPRKNFDVRDEDFVALLKANCVRTFSHAEQYLCLR